MTAFVAIVAAIGVVLSVCVWWFCHWLAGCMDRDDRKDAGNFD